MALRWASDRVGDHGVIGFVTNNGWLTGMAASGVRRILDKEFNSVHVVNLRGKITRVSNDQKIIEGGNVFDVTVGVQIVILIKNRNPPQNQKTTIQYHDMVALGAPQKLVRLSEQNNIDSLMEHHGREMIAIDSNGDWIEQGEPAYKLFARMGDEDTKSSGIGDAIFSLYSNGLKTQMDYLAITSDADIAADRGLTMAKTFNAHVINATTPSNTEPDKIKWYKGMKERLESHQNRDELVVFSDSDIKEIMCKPFLPQMAVWHKTLNWSQYRLNDMFVTQSVLDTEVEPVQTEESRMLHPPPETGATAQRAICIAAVGHTEFDITLSELPPDFHLNNGATQCFPRYRLSNGDFGSGSWNSNRLPYDSTSSSPGSEFSREDTMFPEIQTGCNRKSEPWGYL